MNKRQKKKRFKKACVEMGKLGYHWDPVTTIADDGGTIISLEDVKPVKWVRIK